MEGHLANTNNSLLALRSTMVTDWLAPSLKVIIATAREHVSAVIDPSPLDQFGGVNEH
jgi:hypothetical protein